MQFWYSIDFRCGIAVFADFFRGIAVLGPPNVPLVKMVSAVPASMNQLIFVALPPCMVSEKSRNLFHSDGLQPCITIYLNNKHDLYYPLILFFHIVYKTWKDPETEREAY